MDYKSAGVDIGACDAWLARLKSSVPAIGGFSALFSLAPWIKGMEDPCLVVGTDGVGTKVLVAKAAGDFSTIGIDCVAMVVNDLLCCGARPMFFLDYLAVGKFRDDEADAILKGVLAGCAEAGCELIGGETAELPGLFPENDFDIAGFGVGMVDRARAIDGSRIVPGDVVLGLESSGIHSNGLSLARRALPQYLTDAGIAGELLTPTRIYVKPVLEAARHFDIKGLAHITGGGLAGNFARVLPPGVDARLDPATWPRPAIFDKISAGGNVPEPEMFRAFNMGIGMCVVVAADAAPDLVAALSEWFPCRRIGDISGGTGRVTIAGIAD